MLGTAFCNTSGITLSVNYLVDSYRDIGGDGMTSVSLSFEAVTTTHANRLCHAQVIIIRNTMSFAIGYGITPWLENLGYQNCVCSASCTRCLGKTDVSSSSPRHSWGWQSAQSS